MGAAMPPPPAKAGSHAGSAASDEEIISFVMPIYYTKDALQKMELDAAVAVWKMIINDRSPHFNELKKTIPNFPHHQCMEYFYDLLYNRLFDTHPTCRPLFRRPINKQGSFLVRMISMLINELQDDKEKFDSTLINMAHIHNKLGVKAIEYGIMGECLFFAIKTCVGPAYTAPAHTGWVKIYSRILEQIVPVVVKFEREEKATAETIYHKRMGEVTNIGSTAAGKTLFTERSGPRGGEPSGAIFTQHTSNTAVSTS